VQLIGVVVCLLAAIVGPMSITAGSGGYICSAAALALSNQLHFRDCKARCSSFGD